MNTREFNKLLARFTEAAESGDGERFARLFTPDGVYYDYIYGAHRGRAEIAHMMQNLFHRDAGDDYRWEMYDGVFDGVVGGMSRFVVRDGLIVEYRESVNGGLSMTQLGVEPERMKRVFERWIGWLKDRPETQAYMARPRGAHARAILEEKVEG